MLGMAVVPIPNEPFRHVQLPGGPLFVSRCSACGLVVAASPDEQLLTLVEALHTCPVYLNYDSDAAGPARPA